MAVTQPKLTGLGDGPPGSIVKRKGDHKRKARPIAPATVAVRDGEIVVVVPDVLGKNEAHRQGRFGARVISTATKRYRESVMSGFRAFPTGDPGYLNLFANAGAWRLEVIGVWPRQRDEIKMWPCDVARCPVGDADAAIPQALDALQHAGILDDDARVVEVRAWNLYRKGERWTVIRLVRVPDLAERDAAIAHLVAALPPPTASADGHCPHPARDGKHEVYVDGDKTFCRACGAKFTPFKPRTKAARRKAKETA